MDIDKIVAEMPKADNPFPQEEFVDRVGYVSLRKICGNLIEAQCQLLAEQGWRKVPSEEEVALVLNERISSEEIYNVPALYVRPLVDKLRRRLLEGE